ncbi:MAG TPA: hypothetical protein VM531_11330 [Sphingomicrobium sp.]|nr:hypothetical protein [Sphingomicrobium sp.]
MKIKLLEELIGKRVVVTADHGTLGYMVVEKHLRARRLGAVGLVIGAVPGHGGDVVWVQEEGTSNDFPAGAYCHLNELEFYSDEALIFATKKREKVLEMQRQLDAAKKESFNA